MVYLSTITWNDFLLHLLFGTVIQNLKEPNFWFLDDFNRRNKGTTNTHNILFLVDPVILARIYLYSNGYVVPYFDIPVID